MSDTITETTADQLLNEAYERAQKLGPQQVQVWPGGQMFTSIGAAINSIQSASPQDQYQVAVGPGTYNENVVLKNNVYMSGAGPTQTKLVGAGSPVPSGVLGIMGNCGASMMTINCTGNVNGGYSVGMYFITDANFNGGGLYVSAMDSNSNNDTTATVCAVSNVAGGGQFNMRVSNSQFAVAGLNMYSNIIAVQVAGPQAFTVQMSTIVATGGGSTGVLTSGGASGKLLSCTIAGNAYALCNMDRQSPMTANQCTLDGQVSAGVTVNP